MKTKTYTPKQVLLAVIEYYANHDCKDLDESVEAFFIDDDGTVELEISLEETDFSRAKKKKSVN